MSWSSHMAAIFKIFNWKITAVQCWLASAVQQYESAVSIGNPSLSPHLPRSQSTEMSTLPVWNFFSLYSGLVSLFSDSMFVCLFVFHKGVCQRSRCISIKLENFSLCLILLLWMVSYFQLYFLIGECCSGVPQSCLTLFVTPMDCNFLGKNTGVGCYFLSPGNFPDPGIKPGSPAWLSCTADGFLTAESPGECRITLLINLSFI